MGRLIDFEVEYFAEGWMIPGWDKIFEGTELILAGWTTPGWAIIFSEDWKFLVGEMRSRDVWENFRTFLESLDWKWSFFGLWNASESELTKGFPVLPL